MESVVECSAVNIIPSTVWPSIRTSSMPAAMTSLSSFGTFSIFLEANRIFNAQFLQVFSNVVQYCIQELVSGSKKYFDVNLENVGCRALSSSNLKCCIPWNTS